MRAIQSFGAKLDEIHAEQRKADVTKEKLADLLPNQKDLLPRWKTLVGANTALLKVKYQPEWADNKGDRFCRYRNELDSLETRHKNISQMLTMMRSLKNEGQLKEFLQFQNSKEKRDEMLQKNEDEINTNRDTLCNSEDYKALVETTEETLKRRDEIVAEMVELLKHSGDTSIYSELHRMEGIIARARVNWQEQQLKSRDTSSQKNANEEMAQGTDRPNSFENRCVNDVNSLPEERDQCASKAHSKGNRTSVSSKSTTTKRVMLLELEAMKKQEEIDEQLAAKKREEEMNMRILAEESEIAKLEEEKEKAKRISEKEIEIARAGSSRANTSFRSVSPVPIQSDPFEKVPSWLDQIEVDDKLTKNVNETSRIALASDPIQRQAGAMPHTTKLFQPAAKMAQSTVANVGNSGNLFVPKVASVTLKRGATQHVQFGTMLPPNQTITNNKMTNDTVPPVISDTQESKT